MFNKGNSYLPKIISFRVLYFPKLNTKKPKKDGKGQIDVSNILSTGLMEYIDIPL